MNRNRQILFKTLLFALFTTIGLSAQESKTYKETFNVSDDAVLKINTTHTDIEFDTWDKNQVEIVATVTLEGASDEEVADYFENSPFKMLGNSSEIEVSTSGKNSFSYLLSGSDFDFHFDNDAFIEPLFLDIEIPELPELPELLELQEMVVIPPLPSLNFKQFDYDAYKKDGDKYLKEWTEDFKKNFDEEYAERFEEWGKRYEERAKERAERMQKRVEERAEAMEKRAAELEKRNEERTRRLEERQREREEQRRVRVERRGGDANSLYFSNEDDEPSIFYFSSDGKDKKYKVKKTIKIKMPKSTRLKMNVKHGEVKLASTTKNMNASLRYASLLASTIEGQQTDIRASHTPVIVQKWNYGQLKADYAEHVSLKEVGDLRLNATSSNIIIDRLNDSAMVINELGELIINSVSNDFSDIDISVENGELRCSIPSTPFQIYVKETASDFKYPSKLAIGSSKNYNSLIHKGYHINDKNDKSINIQSKYSEVVLKE